MELRRDIQVDGIPITWETNLSDSDLRDLYIALCHSDSLKTASINMMGVCVFGIQLVMELLPFQEGYCLCYGVGEKITAIYRTMAEWAIWEARQEEIEDLKQEQEQESQLDVFLFIFSDREFKEKVKDALGARRYEDAIAYLKARAELRRQNEQYRNRAHWMWRHQQDFTNLLASLPTSDLGLAFIKECYPCWHWYTSFAHAWIFWRVRYHSENHSKDIMLKACFVPESMPLSQCLREVRKIAEAGMSLLPDDWMLHKDFCVLFDRYNDTDNALWVCRHAVERGLTDDTKTGFIGRLRRLEGKARRRAQPEGLGYVASRRASP